MLSNFYIPDHLCSLDCPAFRASRCLHPIPTIHSGQQWELAVELLVWAERAPSSIPTFTVPSSPPKGHSSKLGIGKFPLRCRPITPSTCSHTCTLIVRRFSFRSIPQIRQLH